MNQPQLDFTRYPKRAGYTDTGTSKEAADTIEGSGRAANLRAAVLRFYADNQGTADECAAALGESPFSIRPRVSELLTQKILHRTGARRPSSNQRSQYVLAMRVV